MSEKQKHQLADREETISQLRKHIEKETEVREAEVERRLLEREKHVRQQERERVRQSFEPLRAKIEEYQQRETEFLKREEALAIREQEIDLRVAREVAQKRAEFLKEARKQAEEKHGIELKESEKTISNLRTQLEEAQRTIQSGSAQRRGKIQEQELADVLESLFPEDEIVRISSGERGADVLQNVQTIAVGQAGSIYWESKRTKRFQPGWLQKLRQDQQEKKADIAALVSFELPDDVNEFNIIEGIVVLHPRVLEPVATLMRQYLLNIARQRLTLEQRETKIQQLYSYMTSNNFLQRVGAIVEAETRLAALNDKERKAHERVWAARDQLHQNIGRNVAQLYGDVEGIVGSLPPVEGLQLSPKRRDLLAEGKDE
jgi:hypothetical protein